jgi:hypothetical protein
MPLPLSAYRTFENPHSMAIHNLFTAVPIPFPVRNGRLKPAHEPNDCFRRIPDGFNLSAPPRAAELTRGSER